MAVSSKPRFRALINATYELQELVASQKEHDVFLARDLRDGSAVLVKRPRPELAAQPRELARFVALARALERLEHPSLPRVWMDADERGGAFVVHELVDGRPLSDLIGAFPQGVPVPLIASVLVPVIEALALAHAAGLRHGALDPSQVLLLGPLHDPSAKLINLCGGREALEQDPSYRAPETTTPTAAADVFACGVMLYHMLSGVLPFQSGKRSAIPLHELAPQAPGAFVQLTTACLSEQPERRPADARALLERLHTCCERAPQQRSTPSPRAPGARAPEQPLRTSAPAQRAGHLAEGARRNAAASGRTQATTLDEEGREPQTIPPPSRPTPDPAPRSSLSPEQAAELLSAKLDARRRASSAPASRPAATPAARASQPSAARRASDAADRTSAHAASRTSQPTAARRTSDPADHTSAPATARASQPAPSQRASGPAGRNSAPASARTSRPSAAQRASAPADPASASTNARASQPSAARRSSDPAGHTSTPANARTSRPTAARRASDPADRTAAPANARTSRPSAARRSSNSADSASAPPASLASQPIAAGRSSGPADGASAPAPGRSSQPTAARGSRPGSSRPPSRKPPVTLTQAQIDALAALRQSYDEQDDRDRWVAVLWVLLLLLLWLVGSPYYLDAGLSKAHATFGSKLRVVATAFSVASVVVAMHPLIAQAGRHWIIQRLRGVVTQTTSGCFILVTSGLYSTAPFVSAAAALGQRGLPWCISFALLLLMLEYLLRGARYRAHDTRYAALVFALALLGSFGTYRALLHGIAHEKQLLGKSKPPASPAAAALNAPAYSQTIQALTDAPAPSKAAHDGIDVQRTSLGADEAQDLQPAQEIERSHKRDGAALERLQKKLPAIPGS